MNGEPRWQWSEARYVQHWSLAVGAVCLGLCALGILLERSPEQFFHSYLLAFITWLAFGLGSLALLMLHHLTGGTWGFVIRRTLLAATRTLPLMALLFLPLLLGLSQNYPWAQEQSGDGSLEPLLLPWGGVSSVRYSWDGSQFVRGS